MFPRYYVDSDMLSTESNIQSHTDVLAVTKESLAVTDYVATFHELNNHIQNFIRK